MNLRAFFYPALRLPPDVVVRKAWGVTCRVFSDKVHRYQDHRRGTYCKDYPQGKLTRYFPLLRLSLLEPHREQICALARHSLKHRFNLLGSGWVQVKHDMCCRGVEGYRYEMGSAVRIDHEGRWLEGRINPANVAEARRIWRLVDERYTPIDWHRDFKSGYRWDEATWYRDIPYGHKPGVDVKVPWELTRMQHLPQLSLAYALSKGGQTGFAQPSVYLREFRNQVLDFIATNPPRFGVNWYCTMDVAIRVANWLVAYDLFRAHGAEFDPEFEAEFGRSIYDHGLHIVANLEWSPALRGNHYLANIVGLLFIAAYLPSTPETDAWLAFAVQELINEVAYQFTSDGANFEASTSYHRLSAELVVYATAMVSGLPQEKQAALKDYDHRIIKVGPRFKPAPLPLYPLPDNNRFTPFPVWYTERLEKMAEFTMYITKPDGRIPQIGDNDSSRFLKLQPVYYQMTVAEAKAHYRNLEGYNELPDDAIYWDEDLRDHRHLVAAINGLFGRDDFAAFTGDGWIETDLVRHLAGDIHLPSYRQWGGPTDAERIRIGAREDGEELSVEPEGERQIVGIPTGGGNLREGLRLYAYPNFGLYLYHSRHLYLAVRCGSIGQNGRGGHAHNDNLSFELSVDGVPILVDAGTYLYTSIPERRNQFRSTLMHNTLVVPGEEQNLWYEGVHWLFRMIGRANANVQEFHKYRFVGEQAGFSAIHRRILELFDNRFLGIDECGNKKEKSLFFHLAPDVHVRLFEGRSKVDLMAQGVCARLQSEAGEWVIEESSYSPAYGLIQRSQMLRLSGSMERMEWIISG